MTTAIDLPAGLTHPFEAQRPQAATYRHGMTFTWTRGDHYIAVQRGRVANARHVELIVDAYPGHDVKCGQHPVVDWMPAPRRPVEWRRDEVMRELADQWLESQRAKVRRSA